MPGPFLATSLVFSLFMTVLPLQPLSLTSKAKREPPAVRALCSLFLQNMDTYLFLPSNLASTLWEFLTPSKKGSETKGNPEYSRKSLADSWKIQNMWVLFWPDKPKALIRPGLTSEVQSHLWQVRRLSTCCEPHTLFVLSWGQQVPSNICHFLSHFPSNSFIRIK